MSWLTEFPWLSIDDQQTAKCSVCTQFPRLADKNSGLLTGKYVYRKSTLNSHQRSYKHIACVQKSQEMKDETQDPVLDNLAWE